MNFMNRIRKTLGMDLNREYFKPVKKGPPENPEYFTLQRKLGSRPKVDLNRLRIVWNRGEGESERLLNLRLTRYAKTFPNIDLDQLSYFNYENSTLDPDHIPKFCYIEENVDLSEYISLTHSLGANYDEYLYFVTSDFKLAVELLDPNLCQFFPFEYRLITEQVVSKRFIMHFPKTYEALIDFKKSGGVNFFLNENDLWSWPPEDIVRNGLLVIESSASTRKNYILMSSSVCFF